MNKSLFLRDGIEKIERVDAVGDVKKEITKRGGGG